MYKLTKHIFFSLEELTELNIQNLSKKNIEINSSIIIITYVKVNIFLLSLLTKLVIHTKNTVL